MKRREVLLLLCIFLILVISQGDVWLTRKLTVSHDTFRTGYGIFAYFFDCLHKGLLPLWNPYSNCGEPFFVVNLAFLHLWDPSALILLLIGRFIKVDIFFLYELHFLLLFLIFISGCYLLFRYIARYKLSAFIAFITITFSSISVSYLRQLGLILHIYTLPWILLFTLKFIDQNEKRYLLGLSLFLALTLQSYGLMYTVIFLAIFFFSLLLFNSEEFIKLLFKRIRENYKTILLAIIFLFLLTLKVLPEIFYMNKIIPVSRIDVTYSAYSKPWDFLALLAPYYYSIYFLYDTKIMSEAFLYIGLFPLFLSIVGIFLGRHRYKFAFLFTLFLTGLLMLGDKTIFYSLFVKYIPLFSIIRNMHIFSSFFIFCLCYFVCLGADVIWKTFYKQQAKTSYRNIVKFLIIAMAILTTQVIFYFQNLAQQVKFSINSNKLSLSGLLFFVCAIFSVYLSSWFKSVKNKWPLKIGYSAVILFILLDLFLFDHFLFKFTTRKWTENIPKTKKEYIYKNLRTDKIVFEPLVYYFEAIVKEFTATHEWNIYGTNFFEMKDYYEFRANQIPDEVKKVITGISSPKLRLIEKGIVLNRNSIINKLKTVDAEKLKNHLLFIEEDVPKDYAHLVTSLEAVQMPEINGDMELGRIEAVKFNPNEIALNVQCLKDCFLYYSDGFDKYWRVFIDGKEDKVYKSNLAFKSVIAPSGNHRIKFIYEPKFYNFDLLLYFGGLLSLLIVSIKINKN